MNISKKFIIRDLGIMNDDSDVHHYIIRTPFECACHMCRTMISFKTSVVSYTYEYRSKYIYNSELDALGMIDLNVVCHECMNIAELHGKARDEYRRYIRQQKLVAIKEMFN